jgi:Uma2 family endonuclease
MRAHPPFTVAEFLGLPLSPDRGYELQEGALAVSLRPQPHHQRGVGRLFAQLDGQAPDDCAVVPAVYVDLRLDEPDGPGTVRTPDLVVTSAAGYDRVVRGQEIIRADEVLLAVEITSPVATRTESHIKHDEYADAGIREYWIVELGNGPGLIVHRLDDDGRYTRAEPVTGTVEVETPFPARIDLARLL